MPHVRSQVRGIFKTILEAGLPETYTVFSSRRFSRNRIRGEAVVDMRVMNVNVEQQTMGDERLHTASLYIRVQRDAAEEDLDDSLDADEVAVTQVIEAYDFSHVLEEAPELVQVNFSDDAESEAAMGSIILRYDIEYRIDKTDPETVVS